MNVHASDWNSFTNCPRPPHWASPLAPVHSIYWQLKLASVMTAHTQSSMLACNNLSQDSSPSVDCWNKECPDYPHSGLHTWSLRSPAAAGAVGHQQHWCCSSPACCLPHCCQITGPRPVTWSGPVALAKWRLLCLSGMDKTITNLLLHTSHSSCSKFKLYWCPFFTDGIHKNYHKGAGSLPCLSTWMWLCPLDWLGQCPDIGQLCRADLLSTPIATVVTWLFFHQRWQTSQCSVKLSPFSECSYVSLNQIFCSDHDSDQPY